MTDSELSTLIHRVTELRLNPLYQAAESRRRRSTADAMARAHPTSDEHAAVRLLVGVWERIAIMVEDCSDQELRRFFRCNPVGLMWHHLEPAVTAIRNSGEVGATFAKTFEELAGKYIAWTKTPDGQEYRSLKDQAVHAHFG